METVKGLCSQCAKEVSVTNTGLCRHCGTKVLDPVAVLPANTTRCAHCPTGFLGPEEAFCFVCDAPRDSELFAPEKMGKLIGAGLQKQNIVDTLATHGGETWPLVGTLSWTKLLEVLELIVEVRSKSTKKCFKRTYYKIVQKYVKGLRSISRSQLQDEETWFDAHLSNLFYQASGKASRWTNETREKRNTLLTPLKKKMDPEDLFSFVMRRMTDDMSDFPDPSTPEKQWSWLVEKGWVQKRGSKKRAREVRRGGDESSSSSSSED